MSVEPRRLGKYELQQRLARGGMGEVWKAMDMQLKRHVAIKMLHADLQSDPDFVVRFEREAQLIAALHHPNIVQIHDFRISQPPESEQTLAYMVMDYVQGQTLADYIRSTSRKSLFPDPADIVYLFAAISQAIDYAHSQGMIHRDIKPANILLDQRLPTAKPMGEPILTDFGIARLQGVATGTLAGSLLGTPLYISPEQAQGKHGDKRSDLYSLGIILYEIMTGLTPFRGETTMAILVQHINDIPTAPNLINPRLSHEVSAIILKSIAKDSMYRFSSASEMTHALAEALRVPLPRNLLRNTPYQPSIPQTPYLSSSSASSAAFVPQTPYQTPTHVAERQNDTQNIRNNRRDPLTPIEDVLGVPTVLPYNQGISATGNIAPGFAPAAQQVSEVSQRSGASPSQAAPIPQQVLQQTKRPNRSLILLLCIALVVLLGSGISYFVLSAKQAQQSSTVTGKLTFINSGKVPAGSYDEVQISLQNVPAPSSGHVYYAWIESLSNESDRPHWKLPLNQNTGTIQTSALHYPGRTNLLMANTVLLITEEDGSIEPQVPYTELDKRHYYAKIISNASATFDIYQCPTTTSSDNACLL